MERDRASSHPAGHRRRSLAPPLNLYTLHPTPLVILQVIAGAAWTPHPNPYTPHPKPRVILQVMTGAAARLAGQQDAKYGAHKNKATAAAWRAYTASTPGLVFPGVAWPPVRPKVGAK